MTQLMEIRKTRGFPQPFGKHKTLSTFSTGTAAVPLTADQLDRQRSTLIVAIFCLKNGKHLRELLNQLSFADDLTASVIHGLEVRNAAHLRFQDRLQALGLEGSVSMELKELRDRLGPVVTAQLEQLTNDLYDLTDGALSDNRAIHDLAIKGLQRLFPKEKPFAAKEIPESERRKNGARTHREPL